MGQLTLVTVPIGNLGDLTERAFKKLKESEFILAEDTRMLKSLLNHLGIDDSAKTIDSFHEHSLEKLDWALNQIDSREEVCLVSDAGSPIVSDPAFPLVVKAMENGHKVETCPGVSSVLVALELSGLPPMPFHFHGFLPREKSKKKTFFKTLESINGTHIFFESPHRAESSLQELSLQFPNAKMAAARELTKKFETIHRFTGSEFEKIKEEIKFKGEFVLLLNVSKTSDKSILKDEVYELARQYMDKKKTPKQLAKLLAAILGQSTSDIYQELGRK